MGFWAQNVGVKGPSLPPDVLTRAAAETFGVPERMEGWSWATLEDFLDLGELDALAAAAGGQAAAPALAFSVHDSDSAYLVGADAGGVRFRLVLNPEAWEDELPRQEVKEAAAWSKDHAVLTPSPEEIEEVIAREFVFAEEGLDVLLTRMGLVPPEGADGAQEMGAASLLTSEMWRTFEPIGAPEKHVLEGGRWHAPLELGDASAFVLAVDEPGEWVSAYGVRAGAPIIHFGKAQSREDLANEATRQGLALGEWKDVPETVPRDLASTAAWVLAQD